MPDVDEKLKQRVDQIDQALKTRYRSEIVPSKMLWRELGFASAGAFRAAAVRGSLGLEVFQMEGRRGLFALRSALAHYLARQSIRGMLEQGRSSGKESSSATATQLVTTVSHEATTGAVEQAGAYRRTR